MNDPLLKDLLCYHQPLNDAVFSHQLLAKIKVEERKRRWIMWVFTLLGLILSALYMWSVLPMGALTQLITPLNGLLLFSIGLFVVWLWVEELSSA